MPKCDHTSQPMNDLWQLISSVKKISFESLNIRRDKMIFVDHLDVLGGSLFGY